MGVLERGSASGTGGIARGLRCTTASEVPAYGGGGVTETEGESAAIAGPCTRSGATTGVAGAWTELGSADGGGFGRGRLRRGVWVELETNLVGVEGTLGTTKRFSFPGFDGCRKCGTGGTWSQSVVEAEGAVTGGGAWGETPAVRGTWGVSGTFAPYHSRKLQVVEADTTTGDVVAVRGVLAVAGGVCIVISAVVTVKGLNGRPSTAVGVEVGGAGKARKMFPCFQRIDIRFRSLGRSLPDSNILSSGLSAPLSSEPPADLVASSDSIQKRLRNNMLLSAVGTY